MGLFRKKTAIEEEPHETPEKKSAKRKDRASKEPTGHTWTQGGEFGAKVTSGLMLAALLCGPVALGLAWAANARPATAVETVSDGGLSVQQQSAGGYALGFVEAWLNATRDDHGLLAEYVDLAVAESVLGDEPWKYRDLALVSIDESDAPNFVTVVVSGSVKESVYDSDGESTTAWPRRFWQVMVSTTDDGLGIASLPAAIDAPEDSVGVRTDYGTRLATTDPAGQTIVDFLGSYLTSAGDLDRYVSPGADMTPINPAPFTQIEPIELLSEGEAAPEPVEGQTLRVLATIAAGNVDSRVLPTTYALTLTARAGRWEVTSVDSTPVIPEVSDGATPVTTPAPEPSSATPDTDKDDE